MNKREVSSLDKEIKDKINFVFVKTIQKYIMIYLKEVKKMLETKRIKEIKNLYKGEIEELLYEEVTKDNNTTFIRIYIKLNDEYNTLLNLGIIGIKTEEKVNELVNLGYKKY